MLQNGASHSRLHDESIVCINDMKSGRMKVCSHNPFFGPNYFSGIVSAHRNVDWHH